ncbi:hypothetical protein [Polluticoccus soli]|uniref:hypothetical protein n=1 Tax=Polluticoccus soli TaxID=3034150 RepID=UPI0023E13E82|nr:hypothetical protein [Flavipsychrobacter sp. JY13-12]
MNRILTKRDFRFLLLLLVVHGFFFVIALNYKRIYTGDSFEYVYAALNIKNHGWFYAGNPALPVEAEYLTIRPPVYPLFLAFVYLFTVNNWVVIILQNLLSIFNIFYLRDTLRKLGYTRHMDYLLVAFIILYPAQFVHTNTIVPDLFLQTCVLVYFRHFTWLWKTKRWRNAFWMSAALIVGLFTKPVLYPFALVHCVLLLYIAARWNTGYFRALLAAAIPLLLVFSYMSWNYTRTGKVHFSSNQSFNAIYYYYFYFSDTQGAAYAQDFLDSEREKIAAMPDFTERYDYANKRGVELLKENFAPYMLYHLKHSARLLVDPGKGEWDMFTGRLTLGNLYKGSKVGFYATFKKGGFQALWQYIEENPSFFLAIVVLLFNCLRLVGLFIFLLDRDQYLAIRLMVVLLIGYFAITTGPIANSRYFMPISLLTIGCATLGYQSVLRKHHNKAIIASTVA